MGATTFSGPVNSTNGFNGNVTGNVTGDVTGNVTGINIGTVTTKSGAGAIPITHSAVKLTTTGANALTLANGTNGQLLTITMVVDGGDGTLTPTTKTGYTTLTFGDVGDSVTLQYYTTQGWMVVANNGVVAA